MTPRSVTECEAQVRAQRETLNDLINRRRSIDVDAVALGRERDAIAFDALTTTDAKAQRRLADVRKRLAALRDDEAELDAAIHTAGARVAFAEEALRDAVDAQKARGALSHLHDLKAGGTRLDACVDALLREYALFQHTCRAIRSLGAGFPGEGLMRVALRRALASRLAATDLELDSVNPQQLYGFEALVDIWATGVTKWAAERLPDDSPEKEAA
jgi:hypothetical protein